MAEELDDLFSGNLDSKMDFLNDKKAVNADGIYMIINVMMLLFYQKRLLKI